MEVNQNNLADLLTLFKAPSLTEKSINLYGNRQYTFLVDRSLKKDQIKLLIEKVFQVAVKKVRTTILPQKEKQSRAMRAKSRGAQKGRKAVYKKAFVQLKEGNTITELFN